MPIATMAQPLPSTSIGIPGALPFVGNRPQLFVTPFRTRWRSA